MSFEYLVGTQTKPLSWLNDAELLAYSQGDLLVCGKSRIERTVCSLPIGGYKALFKKSRLVSRLLRIEPRAALVVGENVLVAWMGSVLLVSLESGAVREILKPREGFSNPLYFTSTNAQGDFLAYWGDYGTNSDRNEVNIYGLTTGGAAKIVYTFANGRIRHVHGIVGRRLGGYYILTGDMEPDSGIYIASDDFSKVEPLAVGEQCYRGVRGFSVADGLVYATDSASIENHLYRLTEGSSSGDGVFSIEDLGVTNGPCIYGGPCGEGFVFTTTVEPDESQHGLASNLSTKLGPGVKTAEATAIFVDSECRPKEIARLKTDGKPLRLLQYGAIMLPSGAVPDAKSYAFARSLRNLDGKTIKMEVKQ